MVENRSKYDFYEKVHVATSNPDAQEVNGELAAVLGKAQNDIGQWCYAVFIYSTRECWSLREEELLATGEFDRRETFYDGASVRIGVDDIGSGFPSGDGDA